MILGILSLLTVGLTSLPAVICGHLSLLRIRKAAGAATGEGVAIAGLVMGYIGLCFFALFFLGIIAGIALPVFNTVQERALVTRSITQAKTIGLALKVYARDHDGRYPARLDDIVPNYLSNKRLLICPLGSSGYNYFGAGITNDAPPTTVLLTSQATTRRHERIVVHLDTTPDLEQE
jgi:type II secretory pathway pseudopilin PulG